MPDLLLEIGTEELPASAVRRAYQELAAKVSSMLISEGILSSDQAPVSLGTPRRLIVSIKDLTDRQPDAVKEQRGPGIKAAYDQEGNPTQALLGFCRGQGVDPADLRSDGQYVWVSKKIPGRSASDILAEGLPLIFRSLTFDKTMRWGSGRMRFARPIRWILALLGPQTVSFDLEGVPSGNESRGHRFYSPEPFAVESFEDLLKGLRARRVEPGPDQRREMILGSLPTRPGEEPDLSESLLDENVFLTEWPVPISGEFSSEFLELPAPVLTTVMAKHEKMFPVLNDRKEVLNRFIFVRNSGEDSPVTRGCEWVLNARMNDAKFFFDEDKRQGLTDFLRKTSGIVFQEKLGTVLSRSERLAELCSRAFTSPIDSPQELGYAERAGRLAKADLATGLVSELASLQGVVGGIYAEREGEPEEVCWAISSQYDPGKNANPAGAKGRTAVRLLVADQIDKLAGYLGLGLEPSGSSDPYGLRRAASILIEAAWGWPEAVPSYAFLFSKAAELYRSQGVFLDVESALPALGRLFEARYKAQILGVRHDVLEAALPLEVEALTSPREVEFRVQLISALAEDVEFVQTATRPLNIVSAARKKQIAISPELSLIDKAHLQSESGSGLLKATLDIEPQFLSAVRTRDLDQCLSGLRFLAAPINKFFEETMVMVDDVRVRDARLSLLAGVGSMLQKAGDFTKLVI